MHAFCFPSISIIMMPKLFSCFLFFWVLFFFQFPIGKSSSGFLLNLFFSYISPFALVLILVSLNIFFKGKNKSLHSVTIFLWFFRQTSICLLNIPSWYNTFSKYVTETEVIFLFKALLHVVHVSINDATMLSNFPGLKLLIVLGWVPLLFGTEWNHLLFHWSYLANIPSSHFFAFPPAIPFLSFKYQVPQNSLSGILL